MSKTMRFISRHLAKESGLSSEVYIYAIKVLLLNISSLGSIIILSWLLGTIKITLITWTAFFSLRIFTGGRHQPGPVTCWFYTVGVFTILGYLITITPAQVCAYVDLLTVLGLVLVTYTVIMHAPVTIASKNFSPQRVRRLKTFALCVLIFWTIYLLKPNPAPSTADQIIQLAIIAGLVIQSVSVLPFRLPRLP